MLNNVRNTYLKLVLVGVLAVTLFSTFFLSPSIRAENLDGGATGNVASESKIKDINQKIEQLDKTSVTMEEIVKILGEPKRYFYGDTTYKKDQLPSAYMMEFEGGLNIVISGNSVNEIRFEADESLSDRTGYAYKGAIRIGTSLDDALKVLGSPKKTVEGIVGNEEGVLYKDTSGVKGNCYYNLAQQGVRMFFTKEKVSSLYLLPLPDVNTQSEQPEPYTVLSPSNKIIITKYPPAADFSYKKQGKLKTLRAYNPKAEMLDYIDMRQQDLSDLDLSKRVNDLKHTSFDTETIWPVKMPEEFGPKKVMEIGKNPGLGIRQLQKEGITGKGVNIGMIDQALLVGHAEYRDNVRMYEEIHCTDRNAAMHGPAMASIAVGKNLGVAPGADLYFIGSTNMNMIGDNQNEIDFTYYAQAIDRMLKINELLPKGDKIRVISMSAGFCPENKGYKEMTQAIGRAKKAGIFVVSCNLFETYGHKYWYHGLDRDPLADPEKKASYSVYPWKYWICQIHNIIGTDTYYEKEFNKYQPKEILLVPMSSRTSASPTGAGKYVFSRVGGWSSVEPYLAGLYAMACQVKLDITPELFLSQMLKTGDTKVFSQNNKKYTGKIINPVRLMESLKKVK